MIMGYTFIMGLYGIIIYIGYILGIYVIWGVYIYILVSVGYIYIYIYIWEIR